jgi:hypothetical protein
LESALYLFDIVHWSKSPRGSLDDSVDLSVGYSEAFSKIVSGHFGIQGSYKFNLFTREFGQGASVDIDCWENGFEVFRIDTLPVQAKVVKMMSFGNRSNMLFVEEAVRPFTEVYPVSILVNKSLPLPAFRNGVNDV